MGPEVIPEQALDSKPTVLVVDDDEGCRYLTREALEMHGFNVAEAVDGEAAVHCFESLLPDIVLLDVTMPVLDGYEACKRLRSISFGHHVPIIMLTGHDDPASIERAYDVGATDFITKPPNFALLVRRLQYVLRASRYFAHFDRLTGLPSRTLLGEFMTRTVAAARRHERPFAVVYIDLDGFQRINESMGHALGDAVLRDVANRLKDSLRAEDLVSRVSSDGERQLGGLDRLPSMSRVGGDEFVAVITDLQRDEDPSTILERISAALENVSEVGDERVFVQASIGISVFPVDGADWDTLLRNAESAARHAKDLGGNRHQYYSGELNEGSRRRFSVERSLREAMANEALQLYYQPKVCLRSGSVVGAEALLRWHHPELGWVPPPEVIDIAEKTGLILPLGEWVLRTACRTLRSWKELGHRRLSMAVNLSPIQVRDSGLAELIVGVLAETQLDPDALELEITEGILMERSEANDRVLEGLKGAGVRLSVDDFGTGFSSLSYLERFPLDKLKIDRCFIAALPTRSKSAAIVNAIVSLAHNLGLTVVAEGVETEEQRTFLRAYGCDEAQGYLLGRPMPGHDFLNLLADQPNAVPLPLRAVAVVA